VGPFMVTSKPSLLTCDSDYDEDGKIVRSDEDGVGHVLMDRRMFGVGKVRMSRWVHAELARTLSAEGCSSIVASSDGVDTNSKRVHGLSWPKPSCAVGDSTEKRMTRSHVSRVTTHAQGW
jgi:hypothetical protein